MDIVTALEVMDTVITVGQVALVVGCPTAGITYLAARILIKEGAKLLAKRALVSAAAGVTATVCASFSSQLQGGGGGTPIPKVAPPGITQQLLEAEILTIRVFLDESETPKITIDNEVTDRENLFSRLFSVASLGNLKRVEYQNELPPGSDSGRYGEWSLFMMELRGSLAECFPTLEFTETTQ